MTAPRRKSLLTFPAAVRDWLRSNPGYGEIFLGWLRRLLALLMLLACVFMGGVFYQQVDVAGIVQRARQSDLFLNYFPAGLERFFVFVFTFQNLRYIFPVLGGMAGALLVAALFVKDVYHLRNLADALRYVVSSMFAWRYPRLNIDNGQKQLPPRHSNLLDLIGGPGYVMIQPGNVVLFRKLRAPSRNALTTSFMMTRFETIGMVASLDDQHGSVARLDVMTRDGIPVTVRDIQFRYRLESERLNNQPLLRTPQRPYPFSHDAIDRMAYNLAVVEKHTAAETNTSPRANGAPARAASNTEKKAPVREVQVSTWNDYVSMQVTGVIEAYIQSHTLDSLTAPREDRQDPRTEMRAALFSPEVTRRLSGNGTQLLWVDIGHFDIADPQVDQQRIGVWAAEWVGSAAVQKAFADAKRIVWEGQGRAEGQAEMIVGIAEVLREITVSGDRKQNLRAILLARVSQVLDAMHDNHTRASD